MIRQTIARYYEGIIIDCKNCCYYKRIFKEITSYSNYSYGEILMQDHELSTDPGPQHIFMVVIPKYLTIRMEFPKRKNNSFF